MAHPIDPIGVLDQVPNITEKEAMMGNIQTFGCNGEDRWRALGTPSTRGTCAVPTAVFETGTRFAKVLVRGADETARREVKHEKFTR